MARFERFIGIDWSGAATDEDGVALAIAVAEGTKKPRIVKRADGGRRTKWSRRAACDWLAHELAHGAPRTLVLVDAGFAFASGAAELLVGARSWSELASGFGALYRHHGTARAVAQHVNARFPDGAPFRFDDARNDLRWYAAHHVPYYRQTELLVPQTISEFYLGSGSAVGFHTITLLAALDALRNRSVAFAVWPFEDAAEGHVLAECYPSLCRSLAPIAHDDPDERDALAMCRWARGVDLAPFFELAEVPVGRDTRKTWTQQIAEEGWILGVPFRGSGPARSPRPASRPTRASPRGRR